MTMDQSAREAGYRFIRDHGRPRSYNRNQVIEWTDEQVHLASGGSWGLVSCPHAIDLLIILYFSDASLTK